MYLCFFLPFHMDYSMLLHLAKDRILYYSNLDRMTDSRIQLMDKLEWLLNQILHLRGENRKCCSEACPNFLEDIHHLLDLETRQPVS